MNTLKLKENQEPPSNYTGIVEHVDGTKFWYKEGLLHRENGPAAEYNDNKTNCWYVEGLIHRLDGPAIEYANGVNEWYIQDECYAPEMLSHLIKTSIFLGKEKGKYNLYWLKFLSETQGIKEFPIIPGMDKDESFKQLFETLGI